MPPRIAVSPWGQKFEVPQNGQPATGPTKAPPEMLAQLLPWLAMGFVPIHTSSERLRCGVYALALALQDARKALRPSKAKLKHPSPRKLMKYLDGKEWIVAVNDYVRNGPLELSGIDEQYKLETIEYLSRTSNLDVTQLVILLDMVNSDLGTNFGLGVVTRGFVDPGERPEEGQVIEVSVLSGKPGQPTIWIHNNNAAKSVAYDDDRGEVFNHWEAFGMPLPGDADRRQVVYSWNLGRLVEEDVEKGVWRAIDSARGSVANGRLEYTEGQFLREIDPPDEFRVPANYMYMVSPDSDDVLSPSGRSEAVSRKGLVLRTSLTRIELHEDAPTAATDTDFVTIPYHDSPVVDGLFRIYRGVSPSKKFGSKSPAEGVDHRLVRDNFKISVGEFLYDLQQREGIWIRVRRINSTEGWAHPRSLEQVESPWDLPPHFTCLPEDQPVQFVENNMDALDEANRWGFGNRLDNEDPVDYLSHFRREDNRLPFGRMTKAFVSKESGEDTKFARGELVLKISGVGNDKMIMVVNYQGVSVVVPSREVIPYPEAWNLAVSADVAYALLTGVQTKMMIRGWKRSSHKSLGDYMNDPTRPQGAGDGDPGSGSRSSDDGDGGQVRGSEGGQGEDLKGAQQTRTMPGMIRRLGTPIKQGKIQTKLLRTAC